MHLHVVGAGLPRTGTTSLKAALEQLVGGTCYHMFEVFPRYETHVPMWLRALDGDDGVLADLLADFSATLDWPASMWWAELVERHPQALVVLSRRDSADTWWRSVDRTVWDAVRRPTGMEEWDRLINGLMARFGVTDFDDSSMAMAAYERHNQAVRDAVPPDRLVEWQPTDGWGPLCTALGVAVPDDPFPHRNTTTEFRTNSGWD